MSKSTSTKQKLFKAVMAASLVTGAVVMVAPVNADAATAKFKDLNSSSVYYQSVIELESRGVIDGFKDGTFKPYSPVTRGQAAKIIANALGLDTVNVKNPGFKDVKSNNQFYGPIAALIEEGIITGFKDDTYRPGDTLTRSQMAKIISLAFDLPEEKSSSNNFSDVNNSSWYKGYVQTLVKYNVTKGTTATLFSPNEAVDRGQIATFVVRAEKAVNTGEEIASVTDDSVKLASGTYNISTDLRKLLNASNAAALAGAKMKFTAKDGVITAIQSLTITKSNVTLDGAGTPVSGNVIINGDSVKLKNVSIQGNLTIADTVKTTFEATDITVKGKTEVADKAVIVKAAVTQTAATQPTFTFVNAKLGEVSISQPNNLVELKGATTVTEVTITANTTVRADSTITIPSVNVSGNATQVTFDIKATIGTLKITNAKVSISLGVDTKITNLVIPEGTNAADVIPNYTEIAGQIGNVSGNPSPPAQGGGGIIITPPPVDESGNQFLYNVLLDEILAGNTDGAVSFGMSGKDFLITINKPGSQFADFELAAANAFKVFKENHDTVVETATVSYNSSIGTATITIDNDDNTLLFDELIIKALNKVGLSKTTDLSILEGRTIGLKVKGTINGKAFDDQYSFKFEAKK